MAAAATLAPAASATEPPVTADADALRTGWYPDEPQLTPQLLEEGGAFGKNFEVPVQGQVYAQPLVVGNTVFVATEDNWIYGIDKRTGAIEWDRDLGTPWDPMDISCEDLLPSVGVTSTAVIDPEAGIAYLTSKSYVSGTFGPAVWRMHAVDVTNGNEEPGFPVEIGGEAENLAGTSFNATNQLQRSALLLMNGVVYAGFGSHCDHRPYQGWIAGVSTSGGPGAQKTLWASWEEGGGVWQGGGGLASDGEGRILFATGNSFEAAPLSPTPTPPADLGDSVVRLNVEPSGEAAATDFFAPWDREALDEGDRDLGSGGVIALPSQYFGTEAVPNLLVETGKEKTVFVLNRDHLGGFAQGPAEKDDVVQELQITKGSFGSSAVWPGDGGYLYIPSNGTMAVLKYSEVLGQPRFEYVAEPAEHGNFGSGSPIVTSDGTNSGSGLVWLVNRCTATPGCHSTLRAYPAAPTSATPQPLFSADVGIANKFNHLVPDEGRIYVGTDGHLLAYGALKHTLTVTLPGAGGTVTSDIGGIDCGSNCSHSYETGAVVTLTATANAGYTFSGWSGGGCTGTGTCQVTMYSDATITAVFAPKTHMVSVSKQGAGEGIVVSRPAGLDCGPICSARFAESSSIVLEALPAPDAVTWSGCTSVAGRICEVSDIESDREVIASFSPNTRVADLPLPDTKIASAKIDRKRRKATFHLSGTNEARSFECKLIRRTGSRHPARAIFAPCASKKVFKHLAPGRYVFLALAVNASGLDPTAARRSFKI